MNTAVTEKSVKRRHVVHTGFVLFVLSSILCACDRLETIDYSPKITPDAFLKAQPHVQVRLGGAGFTLIQPSSSVIVYLAALSSVGAGLYFLRVRGTQRARLWWGIGLTLSGIGALLAGTSYQSFGYEIKCAGRAFCTWTSWWEAGYLLCTGAGMNALLTAVAYSCATGGVRRALFVYAAGNTAVYAAAVLSGAFVPVRFLLTFECLLLAGLPAVALALVLAGQSYVARRDPMSLALLKAWGGFVLVIIAYLLAQSLGLAQRLWQEGIWFTENDVLHVGMILWILHVARSLPRRIEDRSGPAMDTTVEAESPPPAG